MRAGALGENAGGHGQAVDVAAVPPCDGGWSLRSRVSSVTTSFHPTVSDQSPAPVALHTRTPRSFDHTHTQAPRCFSTLAKEETDRFLEGEEATPYTE